MKVERRQNHDCQYELLIRGTTRSLTLLPKTVAEGDAWFKALSDAIENDKVRRMTFGGAQVEGRPVSSLSTSSAASEPGLALGEQAPIWIPDRRVTMCQSCAAEFTVTFR